MRSEKSYLFESIVWALVSLLMLGLSIYNFYNESGAALGISVFAFFVDMGNSILSYKKYKKYKSFK